jgi:AraC-like DNA-binding protein
MLAEICGYEQKKLNQILKNKLGLGLINIVLEVRLLKAYEFIIKNSFSTQNEVMYAVGLNSRSYFNKKFEKRFGIKVGELKKKNDCLNLK